jgi:putative PIN family toxin of toxin-antitoxin system
VARLRALFDTNLYLNYLMSPAPVGPAIDVALDAGAAGTFELMLPEDVVQELAATVAERPHLFSRIHKEDLDALLDWVMAFAMLVPPLEVLPPAVSRDPHDDFLLAVAVLHAADFLVTRDRDLLDLGEILGVRVVDPAAFLDVIRSIST